MRKDSKDSLATYRAKRDFNQTAEPSGKSAVAAGKALRFVIQRHDATRLHYDFRLELDGVFKSWAVTKGPSLDPHGQAPGGRGRGPSARLRRLRGHHSRRASMAAARCSCGTAATGRREGDPHEGLKKGDLKFILDGERLHGSWVLVRMKWDRKRGGKRTNWLLIKHRDESAREGDERRAPEGSQVGRLGPHPEGDRARHGPGADAVHDRQEARGRRGVGEQQEGRRREGRGRAARKAKARKICGDARLHRAAARQAGRAAARRRRLGARDQVRRLSPAAARRGRQGACCAPARGSTGRTNSPPSPSRPQGLPDCIIDGEVVALDKRRRAGFRRPAGGPVGGQVRRPDLLRLRSAVRRRRGSARRCRSASARRGWRSCWTGSRASIRRCATSSISRPRATRCCNRPAACASKASSPSSSTRPTDRAAPAAG